jgi:hypothetical protein
LCKFIYFNSLLLITLLLNYKLPFNTIAYLRITIRYQINSITIKSYIHIIYNKSILREKDKIKKDAVIEEIFDSISFLVKYHL